MVNTNKILTVSYGTFSCTLEGFDDSFGTMKAIAEYFRDLASDDRYFGAEPPTPDAEMLARIAEREISRRVEAHFEENNIVLRANQGSILPLATRAAQSKVEDTDAEATRSAEMVGADTADESADQESNIAPDEESAETALAEMPSGVVTDFDLAALHALTTDSQSSDSTDDEAVAEDRTESTIVEDETEADTEQQPTAEDSEADFSAQSDAVSSIVSQSADSESVAAKLQRIRAVVSHYETAEDESGYSEDEHADDFLADTHEDIGAALEIDDKAEAARSTDLNEDDGHDDIAALLDRYGQTDPEIETAFDEDEDDAFAGFAESNEALEQHDVEQAEAPLRARVIKMKRSDFEALADSHLEEEEDEEERSSLSPDEEAELRRELAAVEAELSSSDSAADLDAEFDDEFDDDIDEEYALEAEENSVAHGQEVVTFADEVDEDAEDGNLFADDEPDAGHRRSEAPFAADADSEMGRIFAETDNQLDEETGKGRRNAIAHLRAAVAATKAERGVGGELAGQGPDTEAYRDDLASVVRPRRPLAGETGQRSRRPEMTRPAPLKLVAEQRVDIEKAADSQPIRPRRVQVPGPVMVEELNDADNFAEFAETVGANSLPELLEAAAAYLVFVEGREQFSRPQLMTRVRQVEQDDFSREDGLRSFGQLLREGKIVKIKGGRFAASDSISYRPDARYAGE